MSTPSKSLIPTFLRVGEIVSLGFRLYRYYFPRYIRLLKDEKYKGNVIGVFARLVFGELQGEQVTLETALDNVAPRIKLYRLTCQRLTRKLIVQVSVFGMITFLLGSLLLLVLSELMNVLWGYDAQPLFEFAYPLFALLCVCVSLVLSCRFYLLTAIVFLELDLENSEAVLHRLDSLTRRSMRRIFCTQFLAMLTIWPLSLPYFACASVFVVLMATDQNTVLYKVLAWLCMWLLGMMWGRIVAPLHLILQIVLYYDLRSRQEGSDLQLVIR